MSRRRRLLVGAVALAAAVALGSATMFGLWLAGVRVPGASGATYLRIAKIAPTTKADRVGPAPHAPFFVVLIGNDSRPGVGGARGDALHVFGVNPATRRGTLVNIPRDMCWNGTRINIANTRGPRAQAEAVGGLLGIPISYAIDVDFAGFTALVDGVGGVDVNVPVPMSDGYSGAFFEPGLRHMTGAEALAFSRNRHDFPQSDITRTGNQGLLILDAMRQLRAQMRSAAGEFKLLALLGRHARLDGIGVKDLYRLGRLGFSLDPAQVRNITVPVTGGGCLRLGPGADALLADLRDDGVVQ